MTGKTALSYAIWLVMHFSVTAIVLLPAIIFLAKMMPLQKENLVEWCEKDLLFYRNNLRIIF